MSGHFLPVDRASAQKQPREWDNHQNSNLIPIQGVYRSTHSLEGPSMPLGGVTDPKRYHHDYSHTSPKNDPYLSELPTLGLQIPDQRGARHNYSHSSDSTSYRVLPQLIFSRNDDVSPVPDFSEPSLSTPSSAPHSYYSPSLSDSSPLYEPTTMLDLSSPGLMQFDQGPFNPSAYESLPSLSATQIPPYNSGMRHPSALRTPPTRSRARNTPRHHQHQYLDKILRHKFPKTHLTALDVAIQYRDEHEPSHPIPNEILDQLLEGPIQDKYYCFCCPGARKARTITPARDHVRKSLGNFPFRCTNPWCQHSALRQADLNKHMKTCSSNVGLLG